MNALLRLCLAALLISPTAQAASTARAVAQVNGVDIPRAAFDAEMSRLQSAGATFDTAVATAVRQRLIARELLWQKVRESEACNAPAVCDDTSRDALIEAYVNRRVPVVEVTEHAVRARYDDILSRLGQREFRFSLIGMDDADALHALANRIAAGADFAREARTHSHLASAANGGELGWHSFSEPVIDGRTNGVPATIAQALAGMQPGQVSPPLKAPDGWVVVRLDAARPTLTPDYAAVRETLRSLLAAQAREAKLRELIVDLLRHARITVGD
ncbi:PPIC-type PPIASE domain protein [Methyloversatilis sp. RAC08]|uniref:peptidylprolyl isomerase n=1 Tax=Methyloversatilis sp. RAC08 TaxID=1842540 RepID=UPI00083CFB51|nr:peptidylprolyl isomerase [Methyloversatilis sp. RAC08]AOF83737.1 PPIC-type PPIASE domain protein [Methyloversatilis sp. RAC08]